MTCRCDGLRATFGAGAPKACGPCALSAERERLIREGWRDVPRAHRTAYLDCGIAVESTLDGVSWAPCWAATLVDAAFGKKWLAVVLMRCAVDGEFRDAALTSLTRDDEDPPTRLHAYAMSCNVF